MLISGLVGRDIHQKAVILGVLYLDFFPPPWWGLHRCWTPFSLVRPRFTEVILEAAQL